MSRMMRKRRANSDSELTLLDSLTRQIERKSLSFDCDSPMMSQSVTDDINIDMLPDSPSDQQLFNGDSTMDPSQMFVGPSDSPENIFPCNSPLCNSPMRSPVPPENTSNIDLPTVTPVSLQPQPLITPTQHTQSTTFFPTQIFFFNTGLEAPTLFISDDNGEIYASEVQEEKKPNIRTDKKKPVTPKKKAKVVKDEDDCEVNKQWINDKSDLKKKGCQLKSGLWSNAEEQLLRRNIKEYCEKQNIADPIKMIYFTPKEDRKEFYRSISTGINRPLFTIYRKVLRIYDSKNYIGKYSADEVEKLEKLNQLCPNDWKSIGLMLGRSASSVKDRARLIKPENNHGRWSDDELNTLSKVIREVTNTKEGESVTDGINWVKVGERVATRTSKQCRKKWLEYLNWKEAGGKEWVKYDEIDLIRRVAKMNVQEENLIDWIKIANGWASVRSPQWLRQKWWQIKKTVPNYQDIKFSELLYHLQTKYVPQLLEKIQQDIDATLIDSKISPFDLKSLSGLPVDLLSDYPDYFGRTFPLTQYELQLLLSAGGDHSHRLLSVLPGNIAEENIDIINEPITHHCDEVHMTRKTGIDFANSLKSETSLSTLSLNNCDFQLTPVKLKVDFGNALKRDDASSEGITFDCDDIKSLSDELDDPGFSETSTGSSMCDQSVSICDDLRSNSASSSRSSLFSS